MLRIAFLSFAAGWDGSRTIELALQPDSNTPTFPLGRISSSEPDAGTAQRSTEFLGAILEPACYIEPNVDNASIWVVSGLPTSGYPRCFSAVMPAKPRRKLPVVIWFSGIGGDTYGCGPPGDDSKVPLAELAADKHGVTGGFVLVCPQALRFNGTNGTEGLSAVWHSQMWDFPQPINDTTGSRCSASRDFDLITATLNHLSTRPHIDTTHLYLLGESMGGAAATFWAVCLQELGVRVHAFGTHSNGIKLRDDGIQMDEVRA